MFTVSRLLKALIPLFVFFVLGLFLLKGLRHNLHTVPSPFINKPVPAFSADSLEKANHQLTNKVFKGHVSLLNVFASWCLYCQSEHHVLMDIYEKNHLALYGLNYKDKRATARKWLKTYGNPYRKIIFDPRGALAVNLGVYGTPETFILDKKGIIRYRQVGPISREEWENKLLPMVMRLEHKE